MSPEQRRARGYAAKALIEDETIKAAFDLIEAELCEQWENTLSLATRKRERLWIELRTVKGLRQKLANFAGHVRD